MSEQNPQQVSILYTNHRGETSTRSVVPHRIWFGQTEWHSEDQWLLDAYDLERQANRSFALKDIKTWSAM
ncbi:WYL domain-containing protein [Patescibacteria group bacterium]|nr:WYL domain-containing protein [Patescibacteria group bacterium]